MALPIVHGITFSVPRREPEPESCAHQVFHEAHVENVELGTHSITIENQAGCTVGAVTLAGKALPRSGPQTVSVSVKSPFRGDTIFIDVACVQ